MVGTAKAVMTSTGMAEMKDEQHTRLRPLVVGAHQLGDLHHRALTEAVQRGFDQVFGLAALLAGVGVVAGLMLPRRLTPSSQPGTGRT